MKLLPLDNAMLRRRILRFNVLAGLLIFAVAVGLSITGEYSNLADREAAETAFNYVAMGGLLYAASSWIFCVMSKPFWFPATGKSENQ
jgi:hypothetical protein